MKQQELPDADSDLRRWREKRVYTGAPWATQEELCSVMSTANM